MAGVTLVEHVHDRSVYADSKLNGYFQESILTI